MDIESSDSAFSIFRNRFCLWDYTNPVDLDFLYQCIVFFAEKQPMDSNFPVSRIARLMCK